MNSSLAAGYSKHAFLGALGSVVGRGIAGLGGRLAGAGTIFARAAPAGARAGAAVASGAAKAERGFSSMGNSLMGGGNAITRGRVAGRMTRRAIGVGALGAGTSALGDKLRGEDVNWGKALTRGAVGAGLGAAWGTSVGTRSVRRVLHPHRSPGLSFSQAANPRNWSKPVGGGRTAWGNLAPLEKGFAAYSGYDAAKAIVNPTEDSAERVGGAIGNTGAMLIGSRWRGMRSTWAPGKGKSWLGSAARSMALLTAGDVAGRAAGKKVDKMRATQEAVDVGS